MLGAFANPIGRLAEPAGAEGALVQALGDAASSAVSGLIVVEGSVGTSTNDATANPGAAPPISTWSTRGPLPAGAPYHRSWPALRR